jgi:hypothetical protein
VRRRYLIVVPRLLERPRLRSRSRKPESTPRVFCTNHNPL